MSKTEENTFIFDGLAGVSSVVFSYDGKYYTGSNVEVSVENNSVIYINAARSGSDKCADWFNSYVTSDPQHMVSTNDADIAPGKMNFAIEGTLKINNDTYSVRLGQGNQNSGSNHPWFLDSPNLVTSDNGKTGTLGGKYKLTGDGTYHMDISLI